MDDRKRVMYYQNKLLSLQIDENGNSKSDFGLFITKESILSD
jgi:hypothetical protein